MLQLPSCVRLSTPVYFIVRPTTLEEHSYPNASTAFSSTKFILLNYLLLAARLRPSDYVGAFVALCSLSINAPQVWTVPVSLALLRESHKDFFSYRY